MRKAAGIERKATVRQSKATVRGQRRARQHCWQVPRAAESTQRQHPLGTAWEAGLTSNGKSDC